MAAAADKNRTERVFLGRYQAIRHLEDGGMASVWLARAAGSDEQVVVKRMQPQFISKPLMREAFRREIDFMSHFRHPYAVALHEAALNDPEGPCIVMEYVPGIPLDTLLQNEKRLSADRVGFILGQLCSVLHALHELGYVHSDIKPANIMVLEAGTDSEFIKILDFGLARKRTASGDQPHIPLRMLVDSSDGTPEYMSPQQLKREPLDPRDDIYSVGIVLYELLAGRRPFAEATLEALLLAQSQKAAPTFAEIGAGDGVSPRIEHVVRSCLAKKRDDRPANVRDLVLEYQDALGMTIWDDAAVAEMLVAAQTETSGSEPAAAMPASSPNQLSCIMEAWMPESIAVMKLRGFLNDLGAEVTESVPGMIRVYLKRARANPQPASGGFLSWLGLGKTSAPEVELTELEIHMQPHESGRPNHLQIEVQAHPTSHPPASDWQPWCEKTISQLGSYLMAKRL